MEFRTNKLSLNLVLASSLLVVSILAFAVTGDTDQPIHAESDRRSPGTQGNAVTFTNNVIVIQGIIKINVDKVVVIRPGDKQGKEVIGGYDKPATFYRMQDDDKPVEGHASQMHYELTKGFVVLTGNAYPQQADSSTKGDGITYPVRKQKIQALSDKGKRVTTVPVPSQLQDKNSKGRTPTQKRSN